MTNIALFGAGRIGAVHATNIAANTKTHLKWVVDVFEQSAKGLADANGAQSTTSVEAALSDPSGTALQSTLNSDSATDLAAE